MVRPKTKMTEKMTLTVKTETYTNAQDLASLYQTSVSGLFAMLIDAATERNLDALETVRKVRAQRLSLKD